MRTEIGGDEIICRQLCQSGYAVLFVEVKRDCRYEKIRNSRISRCSAKNANRKL